MDLSNSNHKSFYNFLLISYPFIRSPSELYPYFFLQVHKSSITIYLAAPKFQ